MEESEGKQPVKEKAIITNLENLRALVIKINASLHDYEGGMNRLDDNDKLKEALKNREELDKKQKDWDSMTISEKIWYTKVDAERTLNYLQSLNKRFNSLI